MSDLNQSAYLTNIAGAASQGLGNLKQSDTLSGVTDMADLLKKREEEKKALAYGIPLSDADYDLVSAGIAQSKNPQEERWNWASALMYSQRLGVPVETAKRNLSAISDAWLASGAGGNAKSHFEAITDSFRSGDLMMQAAELATQWKNGGGVDTAIERQIDDLYTEMDKLQDRFPRNILVDALKFGAQSAPFTGRVMIAGAEAGLAATAAIVLAGGTVAGSAASAGTLAAPGVAVTAAALTAAAARAGSFMESFRLMKGLEYYDMRKRGVSHSIASPIADVSAGLQAAIESSLGNVPGLVGKVGGNTITSISGDIAKRLMISGKWGAAARTLATYSGEIFEEGTEEALQQIASDVSKNIAYGLENKGIPKMDAASIAKDAWENFKGGALGALSMGVPGAFIGYKQAASQTKALRDYAAISDKETFLASAAKWAGVADVPEAQRKAGLEAIWASAQKKEAAKIAAAPAEQPAPVKAFNRTESGTLYTEEKIVDSTEDGHGEAILKVGDAKDKTLLGYLKYTIDEEAGITLTGSSFDKGYSGLREEAIQELAAKYPGQPIMLSDGADAKTRAAYERVASQNPHGADKGAQWYDAGDDIGTAKAKQRLRLAIADKMPNITPPQREAAILIHEFRANAMGKDFASYVADEFQGEVITTDAGRVSAAQGNRAGIRFTKNGQDLAIGQFVKDAKALIMVTEKSDFVSFVHESGHLFRKQLIGTDLGKQLDSAYGIMGGVWTREHEERFADDLTKYLTYGEVKDERLRGVFQRIADWITKLYNTVLSKQADVDPRVREVMDQLFASEKSPLAEAAQTQAVADEGKAAADAKAVQPDATETDLFQYVGERASLNTYEKRNLTIAKKMDKAGKDSETIRMATGWFKGKYDGQWRLETNDKQTSLVGDWPLQFDGFKNLGDVLYAPKIYDKYPFLKKAAFSIDNDMEANGQYIHNGPQTYIYFNNSNFTNTWEARQTMLHEVQHAIQDYEGFAKGSSPDKFTPNNVARKNADLFLGIDALAKKNNVSPDYFAANADYDSETVKTVKRWVDEGTWQAHIKDYRDVLSYSPYNEYRRTAGEIEARDVASRMGLSPEQRKHMAPYSSEDISPEDAVVLFQPEPTHNEQAAFDSAIANFGTTNSVYEAGYVLPDGKMLDFSGRNQATGYHEENGRFIPDEKGNDYLKDSRNVDHREIDWNGASGEGNDKMNAFIGMGAIRIDANSGLANMGRLPTEKQWNVIKSIVQSSGTAWIEMEDGKRRAIIEADGNPTKALGYIRRFYNGEDFNDTILFQSYVPDPLETQAKADYGTTTNHREAGFIFRDGTMLDMSGRHEMPAELQKETLGIRMISHPDVAKGLGSTLTGFLARTGAMRYDAKEGIMQSVGLPNRRQIAEAWNGITTPVTLEVLNEDGQTISDRYIDEPTETKVMAFYRQIEATVLYQADEETIRAEAKAYPTWQAWKADVEASADFLGDQSAKPEGLSGAEADAWYKAKWEEAQAPQEVKRGDFTKRMEKRGEIEKFLNTVWDAEVRAYDPTPAMDAEEQAQIEDAHAWRQDLESRLKSHPLVLLAAQSVGNGKRLSDKTRKSVLSYIRNNETAFKELYADLTNDAGMKREVDAERAKVTSIRDPNLGKYGNLSIAERTALLNRISDKEVKARLQSGEYGDADLTDYVRRLEEEKTKLAAEVKKAEDEIGTLGGKLEVESDFAQRMREKAKLAGANAETIGKALEKAQAATARLEEARIAYKEALASAKGESRLAVQMKRDELMDALKSARQEAALQTRMKAAEIRAAYRLREQREALRKAIMKAPAKNIAWEQKQTIKTIQDYLRSKKWQYIEETDALGNKKRKRAYESVTQPDGTVKKVPVYTTDETETMKSRLSLLLRESPNLAKYLTQDIVDRINDKPVSAWTVAELTQLKKTLDLYAHIGRIEYDAKQANQEVERMTARQDAGNAVLKGRFYQKPFGHGSDEQKKLLHAIDKTRAIEYAFVKMRQFASTYLDNGKDGANTTLLVFEERKHYTDKMAQVDRRMNKVWARMKELGLAEKDLKAKVTIGGVGPGGTDYTVNKSDLMAMRLALLDPDARSALIFGNLFSEEERRRTTSATLKAEGERKLTLIEDAVAAQLSDKEKEIADMIGQDFDKEFDRLNKAVISLTNEEMVKVAHYFPIHREGAYFDKFSDKIMDELKTQYGMTNLPSSGFTLERIRIGAAHQTPMKLDLLSTWQSAVDRQEHLVAYGEYIKKLNAVYKSRKGGGVREAIIQSFGKAGMDYVDRYISEVANPGSMKGPDPGDKAVKMLRGNMAVGYLAFRWTSVVKQAITSPLPYMAYAPKGTLAASMALMKSGHPLKWLAEIEGMSEVLKHRNIDQIFEAIRNLDKEGFEGFTRKLGTVGMKGIEYADRFSAAIGWKGVYDEAIQKGKTVEEAKAEADDVTIRTQPSARGADMAPAFRESSEWKKVLLMFAGPLNTIYNQIRFDIPQAMRNKEYGKAIGIASSYVVAGILLGAFAKLRGQDEPPENEAWYRDWIVYSLSQFSDSVPLIGNEVTGFMKRTIGGDKRRWSDSSSFPAAQAIIDGATNVTEGKLGDAAKNLAEGLGMTFGFPTLAVTETTKQIDALFGQGE